MKHLFVIIFSVFCLLSGNAQTDSIYVLDLQQCIDIAIENNLSIKRSELQKERSRVDLTQSRANQLPDLNAGGNYGRNWGRSIDPTTNNFITEEIQFSGFSGNSSMVLFNWFRLTNTVKQNRTNLDAAEYDMEKARNDVSLDIVTFYLNVIFNRELLKNAEYQLESSEEQLNRTKKLVANGALPRTNELELISQVATNEVNLVTAENNLNLALLNLKQAMLIPASQRIELVFPDLELKDNADLEQTAEAVYMEALDAMPEIQSAKLNVESAVMGVKIAEAGYAPTLSLNGSFRTNYSSAFQQFIPDADNPFTIETDPNGNPITSPTPYVTEDGVAVEQYSITQNGTRETIGFNDQVNQNLSRSLSLNLSVPIFNNLQAKSNVQRAKINLQQAEIVVKEQEIMLRQQIESAYNDAQAAAKTYTASEKQVAALEETFRSIEHQYNLGAANFTDYQVGSNNLFQARSDFVRAKFDFIFKSKILDFYQGKSLTF